MSDNSHFQTHPQLVADSHFLFNHQRCQLRLHKNASLPWIIIIPQTDLIEFHDLTTDFQLEITGISQTVSVYFKKEFATEKINFAAIGNVVQQLHIHVIGRHHKDPLWPDVIWGKVLPEKPYTADMVSEISQALQKLLDKKP